MPTLRGPHGPIEYTRDALGYPSIRARDFAEGAWARGWFHAVDRLVQIQLALLIAHGRAMEHLGDAPMFRTLDRITRGFDFTSDAAAQAAAVGAEARAIIRAYCDGFDAGVAARGWPLVLRALRVKRAPYTPEHMVVLQRLYWYFGLTQMQHGAEGILAELAVGGADARTLELLAGEHVKGADLGRLAGVTWPPVDALLGNRPGGSNAIAIAARRSRTGGALLLADPHLEVARHPPTLYASHTDLGGGRYYQGTGLPGVWFLSFGRTEAVAWAYTYGHGDNVDYLIERCQGGRFLAAGEWRPLRRRVEEVRIKGKRAPESWVFWDNDYGTVFGDAAQGGDLPCIRWTGLREMARQQDEVAASTHATDAAGCAAAMRGMRTLSLHGVFADAKGEIAYAQLGQVDTRPDGWRDVLPWPAWELAARAPAPLDEAARPVDDHPADGFIVSANEARQGPGGERWCAFPEPRYRHERLTELIAASPTVDLSTLVRAAYDPVDAGARRLMAVWAPHLPDDADARALAAWAARQGACDDAHLRQMGLFHALHEEVVRALLGRRLGAARTAKILDELVAGVLYQHHLDDALALERPHLLDARELAELLAIAWPIARDRATKRATPAPVRVRFHNALTRGKLALLGFDTGPYTLPGGPVTPFQSRAISMFGERVVFGSGCHYLVDLSQPGGWYNLPGGASERRFGPGYGKGPEAWLRGEFAPLGPAAGEAPSLARALRA